jgi:PAS domain S-box-containing protein
MDHTGDDSTSGDSVFRLSYEQMLALLDALPDMVYVKDRDGRNRIVNKAFSEFTGLAKEQIAGRMDEEILPADLAAFCRESDTIVFQTGEPYRFEERSLSSNGRKIDFETIKAPVLAPDGRVVSLIGISRDITQRKAMKALVDESAARFRDLFDNMTIGLYRTTAEGRIILANPAILRMLGYDSFAELAARNLTENGFEPEYPRAAFQERIAREGEIRGLEAAWKRRDGTIIHVRESARLLKDPAGRIVGYEGTVEDISERRLAEEDLKRKQQALETALAEKEVLLKEIHHRVKNNMQVISSLLNLQSRYLKHPLDVEIFKESQRRIRSMALIHEMLYQSESLSQIDFGEYVSKLLGTLRGSMDTSRGHISYRLDVQEVRLDIQAAIPCGFIVNELVSNALKHAFPGERRGEIAIGLTREGDDSILLTVRDDGVGLPLGVDPQTCDSMGLQLVATLVQQIDGTITLEPGGGARFAIRFRDPKPKTRA